jgi:hypothetical protein
VDGCIPPLPPLPPRLDRHGNELELTEREWPDYAHRAWVAWWMDPASQMWDEADVETLERCLELRVEMRHTVAAASELRQLTDRLGLNQKGKRDLRLKVDRSLPPVIRPTPAEKAQTVRPQGNLQAVPEPEPPAQLDDYRAQMGLTD